MLIAYDLHQRPGDPPSLGGAPAGTAPIDRFALQETVSGAVNRVLGKARGAHFGFQRPLMEMGLDSLELLELRVVLGQALHTELSPTFFFRYSTPEAIVRFFQEKQKRPAQVRSEEVREAEKLAPQQTDGSAGVPVEAHTDASPPLREAIAVIGMACRFPGGVTDGDSFWELMQNGVDAIGSIPAARWHLEEALRAAGEAGESASRYGGFLDEVDHFDAAFFRIAPVEAVTLDPQHRLLLETHWEALEQAAIDPHSLYGTETGVFVGMIADDYKLLQVKEGTVPSAYFGSGNASSMAAGRVAYFLGLQGPAMVVDTACSSSLVAVQLACRSLQLHESSLALASGVNLLLSPELSLT
ncbi:MAG: type I polyketide synthase, partial [Caldilinea sp.]